MEIKSIKLYGYDLDYQVTNFAKEHNGNIVAISFSSEMYAESVSIDYVDGAHNIPSELVNTLAKSHFYKKKDLQVRYFNGFGATEKMKEFESNSPDIDIISIQKVWNGFCNIYYVIFTKNN